VIWDIYADEIGIPAPVIYRQSKSKGQKKRANAVLCWIHPQGAARFLLPDQEGMNRAPQLPENIFHDQPEINRIYV